MSSQSSSLHFIPLPLVSIETWKQDHCAHFCRILCNTADCFHAMASVWPYNLFCEPTTLVQLHLNWTQHSLWDFTGEATGQMIILCHFQNPLLLTICDKFIVLRTIFCIQQVMLFFNWVFHGNIYKISDNYQAYFGGSEKKFTKEWETFLLPFYSIMQVFIWNRFCYISYYFGF